MAVMLLEWVITSAFLILVVLALRAALGKRMSARLRYALWAVVLVRLLVPVQLFTSPLAGTRIFSESHIEQDVVDWPSVPTVPSNASGDNALPLGEQGGQTVNFVTAPQAPDPPTLPDPPEPPAAPDLTKAPVWLGWVWLAGSAAVALVLLVSNLRFYWKLRRERIPMESVDCPLRMYAAVGLPSPCLFGMFRPAIYVTPEAAADPDMLRHVIAHEYTHYRQGDHLWSLLRCAALAAHWWNPLVWLAAVLSQRDAELACDEGALKRLGDGERAGYGNTLLTLVTAKPRPADLLRCATTMAGDKKSLKERISRIAKAPKRVIWAVVVAVLVTALACVCAFGQAAEPEEAPDQDDQHYQSEHLGPSVDVEAVPDEVLAAALDYVESMYGDFLIRLEMREPHVDIEFDDWRIERLEGPWTRTAQGTEIGVWRLGCTVHTPTPEQAKVLLAGGMTLSEDGWMTPTDSATWLIFLKGEDGKWRYSHAMEGDASATDQPDSDFFWSRATNGIPGVTDPHFTADMTGIPGDVLSLASFYGEERLAACQAGVWEFNALPDGLAPGPGQIEFDGWRITSLKGPWRETVNGTEMEVWRLNCEVHTTEPERVEQAIMGGMYLTEDGWFGPDYPDCTYLVFVKEEDGGWRHCTDVIVNSCGPDDERFSSEGQAQFWKYIAEEVGFAHDSMVIQPQAPDLNRNGAPETLQVVEIDGGQRLEVWENGKQLFSEEGYFAHAGYNAVFLCTLNDKDYLLRYHPYMGQGWCDYSYQLFTLTRDGQEQVVRANSVEFDINFDNPVHESFDPEAIAAFMDEINSLLAHSVQLINTDEDLLSAFEKNGRLYDDLWWLDAWKPVFVRDVSKSLLENLRDFKEAMEGEWYAGDPEVTDIQEAGSDHLRLVRMRYQDRTVEFFANWDSYYQPSNEVKCQVLDLNSDGRDEIVCIFTDNHGTGVFLQEPHIFDAQTLEEYNLSGLRGGILEQINSTGDEENFYLSAPGLRLDETISRQEVREGCREEIDPMADTLNLGDWIGYTIEDGQMFCWLGCDATGVALYYPGYVKIQLNFTGSGFQYGAARYTTDRPFQ